MMNIYFKKKCKYFLLKLVFCKLFIIIACCPFSLTAREKYEREHKKRLLHLAKEHEKARELEMVRRYHMPQDCKVRFYYII